MEKARVRALVLRSIFSGLTCSMALFLGFVQTEVPAEEGPPPKELASLSALRQDLHADSWKLRVAALRDLGLFGEEAAAEIETLRSLARYDHAVVRQAALEALAELGPRAGFVSVFVAALQDPERAVRLTAIEGLGEWGSQAAAAGGALKGIVEDADAEPSCQRAARWALRQVEGVLPEGAKEALPAAQQELLREMGADVKSEFIEADRCFLVRWPDVSEALYDSRKLRLLEFMRAARSELYLQAPAQRPLSAVFHAGSAKASSVAESFGARLDGVCGAYGGDRGVLFCNVTLPPGDAIHEAGHALLHHDFGFCGRWGQDGVGVPRWMDEGLSGVFEGGIEIPNQGRLGHAEVLTRDVRYQILLAALQRSGRIRKEGLSWQLRMLPEALPCMSLEWLFELSNAEFERYYTGGEGPVGQCLAREFLLYLWVKKKLRPFYEAYRKGIVRYRTRRYRAWFASRTVKQAVRSSCGVSLAELEKDFLAWTVDRGEEVGVDPLGARTSGPR